MCNEFTTAAPALLSTWHETYVSLRKIARGLLNGERPSHTLSSGDLVAQYVEKEISRTQQIPANGDDLSRLVRMGKIAMYRLLVDYADTHKVRLSHRHCEIEAMDGDGKTLRIPDPVRMAEYLDALAQVHPRPARVVDLRFYWGMKNKEIAKVLGVSDATVERDWVEAREWLRKHVIDSAQGEQRLQRELCDESR